MSIKAFWKSLSALIVALLIVMAFFRGAQAQWLMIGAFCLWAAFVAVLLIKSVLSGGFHALGAFLVKSTYDGKASQADISQFIIENRELKIALMNQIVLRITENLQYCYPDAVWKWSERNPLDRIVNQEPCRISILNVTDFNFADIHIDARGGLNLEFGKKVSLNELRQSTTVDIGEAGEVYAADDWFREEGCKVLNDLICELNAAGYSKFFISESGEISIIDNDKPQLLDTDFRMPAISLAKLKELLQTIRLNSEMDGDKLSVSV